MFGPTVFATRTTFVPTTRSWVGHPMEKEFPPLPPQHWRNTAMDVVSSIQSDLPPSLYFFAIVAIVAIVAHVDGALPRHCIVEPGGGLDEPSWTFF